MNVPIIIYVIVNHITFYVQKDIFDRSHYLKGMLPKYEDTIMIVSASSK